MTERIVSLVNPTAHTTPGIYLINVMTRETQGKRDILEHFKIDPDPSKRSDLVEVELKINGVSVDFEKSVNEMWERLSSRFDENVLEKAKELVSGSRLDKLSDILNRVEWELKDEVEKLFNVKIDLEE